MHECRNQINEIMRQSILRRRTVKSNTEVKLSGLSWITYFLLVKMKESISNFYMRMRQMISINAYYEKI